jgi:hypothetical protein
VDMDCVVVGLSRQASLQMHFLGAKVWECSRWEVGVAWQTHSHPGLKPFHRVKPIPRSNLDDQSVCKLGSPRPQQLPIRPLLARCERKVTSEAGLICGTFPRKGGVYGSMNNFGGRAIPVNITLRGNFSRLTKSQIDSILLPLNRFASISLLNPSRLGRIYGRH